MTACDHVTGSLAYIRHGGTLNQLCACVLKEVLLLLPVSWKHLELKKCFLGTTMCQLIQVASWSILAHSIVLPVVHVFSLLPHSSVRLHCCCEECLEHPAEFYTALQYEMHLLKWFLQFYFINQYFGRLNLEDISNATFYLMNIFSLYKILLLEYVFEPIFMISSWYLHEISL